MSFICFATLDLEELFSVVELDVSTVFETFSSSFVRFKDCFLCSEILLCHHELFLQFWYLGIFLLDLFDQFYLLINPVVWRPCCRVNLISFGRGDIGLRWTGRRNAGWRDTSLNIRWADSWILSHAGDSCNSGSCKCWLFVSDRPRFADLTGGSNNRMFLHCNILPSMMQLPPTSIFLESALLILSPLIQQFLFNLLDISGLSF